MLMSAWMVSNYHVNALATFAQAQGIVTDAPATALMLWRENGKSIRYRYPDHARDGGMGADDAELQRDFVFQPVAINDLWTILKSAQCYDYQACEHPGYADSDARAVADKIEVRAIELLGHPVPDPTWGFGRYPGYDSAPWGLDEPTGAAR